MFFSIYPLNVLGFFFTSVQNTFVSFHVFGNQIYVESTGDVFVLNGETTGPGASAEFLPPLDEISNGPFHPKALFTFFSHGSLQGWAVMENWLEKKSISTWSQGGNG